MSAEAASNATEQIPDSHHPAGVGLIKPGYDPQLTKGSPKNNRSV